MVKLSNWYLCEIKKELHGLFILKGVELLKKIYWQLFLRYCIIGVLNYGKFETQRDGETDIFSVAQTFLALLKK